MFPCHQSLFRQLFIIFSLTVSKTHFLVFESCALGDNIYKLNTPWVPTPVHFENKWNTSNFFPFLNLRICSWKHTSFWEYSWTLRGTVITFFTRQGRQSCQLQILTLENMNYGTFVRTRPVLRVWPDSTVNFGFLKGFSLYKKPANQGMARSWASCAQVRHLSKSKSLTYSSS